MPVMLKSHPDYYAAEVETEGTRFRIRDITFESLDQLDLTMNGADVEAETAMRQAIAGAVFEEAVDVGDLTSEQEAELDAALADRTMRVRAAQSLGPEARTGYYHKVQDEVLRVLIEGLVSWDVTNENGEIEALAPETIRLLPPKVRGWLLNQIVAHSSLSKDDEQLLGSTATG